MHTRYIYICICIYIYILAGACLDRAGLEGVKLTRAILREVNMANIQVRVCVCVCARMRACVRALERL